MPASTETTKKRVRGKPFVKDDPRRAKGGRPQNKISITHWINEFGQMTPTQVAEQCALYSKQLKEAKGDLPIFGLIAVRALMELMNDPTGSLFGQVLDRTEGKVALPIETWQDRLIMALREGNVTTEEVEAEIGTDAATELFNRGRILHSQNRETPAADGQARKSVRPSLVALAPRPVEHRPASGENKDGGDGATLGQDDHGG